MSVQLLLLLALVGPFCAVTHAVPTQLPEHHTTQPVQDESPVYMEATIGGLLTTVATLPPSTEPAATTTEVTSEAVTEVTTVQRLTEVTTVQRLPEVTTVQRLPEVTTVQRLPEVTAFLQTETDTTDVTTPEPEVLTSDPTTPAAETEAPTDPVDSVQTRPGEVAEAEVGEDVVVEGDAAEGLSSGQVVGIIVGALLAVVVVVAVVIVVVRRMGKYSP